MIDIEAEEGDEDDIAELLVALSDMHIAAGGLGLTFKPDGIRLRRAAGVVS